MSNCPYTPIPQSTIDYYREHINGMCGGECLEFLRGLEDAQAEVERLRVELASVREDAARYAWLKNGSPSAVVRVSEFDFDQQAENQLLGSELDAAIDAARKDG